MSELFQQIDTSTPDESALMEALVSRFGDGDERLKKAKLESDRHIAKIEAENAQLRQKVTSQSSLDEIMTQIKSMNNKEVQPQINPPAQQPVKPDEDSVKSLLESMLAERDAKSKINQAKAMVEQEMVKRFGADAQLHVNKKAQELGLPVSQLADLALSMPSAFLKLFDTPKTEVPQPPSLRNRQEIQPSISGQRDYAFYQKLKTQNPTEYFSSKIQNQMYSDAMKMGESFYN